MLLYRYERHSEPLESQSNRAEPPTSIDRSQRCGGHRPHLLRLVQMEQVDAAVGRVDEQRVAHDAEQQDLRTMPAEFYRVLPGFIASNLVFWDALIILAVPWM